MVLRVSLRLLIFLFQMIMPQNHKLGQVVFLSRILSKVQGIVRRAFHRRWNHN